MENNKTIWEFGDCRLSTRSGGKPRFRGDSCVRALTDYGSREVSCQFRLGKGCSD